MPTLFDQLLGSWSLVSYEHELEPGRAVYPLGEDAVGSIVYTPQHRMAVNIMRPGRTSWESPRVSGGSTAEAAEAATGYIAYAGGFIVDENAFVVEHHVDVSLFPNWVGETQRRRVDLAGDILVLEAPTITDAAGNSATPRLQWRRVM
jgi:hypothetical protein